MFERETHHLRHLNLWVGKDEKITLLRVRKTGRIYTGKISVDRRCESGEEKRNEKVKKMYGNKNRNENTNSKRHFINF